MTAKFRYIGITDECIECQACGKPGLKSTVVLAVLNQDGATEEITYYGSTCAAKALGIRATGKAVLQSARWAQDKTIDAARDARRTLADYGLPTAGGATPEALDRAVLDYAGVHRTAMWAAGQTYTDWRDMVLDMIVRKQAAIAEAALIGA